MLPEIHCLNCCFSEQGGHALDLKRQNVEAGVRMARADPRRLAYGRE